MWSNSLQQYPNQKIEMDQKRAMRIIYPYTSYDMALSLSSVLRLEERRLRICSKTFTNACDPTSRLFSNVPLRHNEVHGRNLRHVDHVSFFPRCCALLWWEGLRALTTPTAMSAGAYAPGRFNHDELVYGRGAGLNSALALALADK